MRVLRPQAPLHQLVFAFNIVFNSIINKVVSWLLGYIFLRDNRAFIY